MSGLNGSYPANFHQISNIELDILKPDNTQILIVEFIVRIICVHRTYIIVQAKLVFIFLPLPISMKNNTQRGYNHKEMMVGTESRFCSRMTLTNRIIVVIVFALLS